MKSLGSDEERLVRLFRYFNSADQHELLKNLTVRLLSDCPIDHHLRFCADPKQVEQNELGESTHESIYRVMPVDSYITDLHDHDVHFERIAWDDEVTEILLGSSQKDPGAAEMLIQAYLAGVEDYRVPLPTEFGVTEEEMVRDFLAEAVKLIQTRRETFLSALEKCCSIQEQERNSG
ncbi:MAG: hypothetical protein KAS94_07040 [Desulfobulbaceae bacterium]|nr:hypothetical protein [Desulfobulbaceae bacterium]